MGRDFAHLLVKISPGWQGLVHPAPPKADAKGRWNASEGTRRNHPKMKLSMSNHAGTHA